MLKEKFIVLSTYIRNERFDGNGLNFCLKNMEKGINVP
jgi:hypothetical protein